MKGIERERVVVVGGGAAAAECAAQLRISGYDGSITVISSDSHPPYELPALSKAFLLGHATRDEILIRSEEAYAEHDIEIQLETTVTAIEPAAHRVLLSDGSAIAYDKLVIATGGTPRQLPLPGAAESAHVHYLRSLSDAQSLRDNLRPGQTLAVVGGGYLGLEVASVARSLGADVTVLEGLPRLLARVTSPPVSEYFARMHREQGVEIRLEVGIEGFRDTADGRVEILLKNSAPLVADHVLVSIGLIPNVKLAEDAGLEVENGIRVDELGRTSEPDIFAAGDCASHPDSLEGGFRRLESLPSALETATIVASTIAGGAKSDPTPPWFWSEQFSTKLQTVGLYRPGDEPVVRGDATTAQSFTVFYLRDGRVAAADVLSSPRDFAAAKSLVTKRLHVDASDLANTDIPIKEILRAAASHGSPLPAAPAAAAR